MNEQEFQGLFASPLTHSRIWGLTTKDVLLLPVRSWIYPVFYTINPKSIAVVETEAVRTKFNWRILHSNLFNVNDDTPIVDISKKCANFGEWNLIIDPLAMTFLDEVAEVKIQGRTYCGFIFRTADIKEA